MDKRVVANEILLEDAAALMEEGREVTLRPLGFSMLPFIRGGKDSVRLKKMPAVAVGDMLLVRLPGPRYVLHRLIGKEGDRLTLMGDGNLGQMEICGKVDVIGTVVAIVRGNKTIKPSKGTVWKYLLPFRRVLLGIYRRIKCR
jgi:hypothetical protein